MRPHRGKRESDVIRPEPAGGTMQPGLTETPSAGALKLLGQIPMTEKRLPRDAAGISFIALPDSCRNHRRRIEPI